MREKIKSYRGSSIGLAYGHIPLSSLIILHSYFIPDSAEMPPLPEQSGQGGRGYAEPCIPAIA
jgi:hypothetical protein